MKRKFEVTLPFKRPMPWYTGICMAENKAQAISIVEYTAKCEGFNGKRGLAKAVEVQ